MNYNENLFFDDVKKCFCYCRDDGSFIEFEKSEVSIKGLDKWTEVFCKQGPKLDILWLPENSSNTVDAYIETVTGRLHYFDVYGRLIKICYRNQKDGVIVSYIGEGNQIDIIRDPEGRQYCFKYKQGVLSAIVCKDKNNNEISIPNTNNKKSILTIQYEYDKWGNLTNAIYPDGEIVTYEYKKNGTLINITNIDNVSIDISYDRKLVDSIVEKNSLDARQIKSQVSITRNAQNKAIIKENGSIKTRTFNDYGYDVPNETRVTKSLNKHVCNNLENLNFLSFIKPDNVLDKSINTRKYYTDTNNSYINEILTTETKERYTYDLASNLLIEQENGNGGKTQFEYDSNMNLIKMVASISNLTNSVIANEYNYEKDRLTTISHNGFSYLLDYTSFGDIEAISIGDSLYVAYDYDSGYGTNWVKITYGNGQSISRISNDKGELIGISFDEGITTAYKYVWDENGTLMRIIDNVSNTEILYADDGLKITDGNNNTIYSIEYIDTNVRSAWATTRR